MFTKHCENRKKIIYSETSGMSPFRYIVTFSLLCENAHLLSLSLSSQLGGFHSFYNIRATHWSKLKICFLQDTEEENQSLSTHAHIFHSIYFSKSHASLKDLYK